MGGNKKHHYKTRMKKWHDTIQEHVRDRLCYKDHCRVEWLKRLRHEHKPIYRYHPDHKTENA